MAESSDRVGTPGEVSPTPGAAAITANKVLIEVLFEVPIEVPIEVP